MDKESEPIDEEGEPQVAAVEFVRDLYLRSRPTKYIARKVMDKFGLSRRMAYYYVSRVRDEYRVHSEEDREDEIAAWLGKLDKLEGEYEEIEQLAIADGDYMAAKSCKDSKLVIHRERAKFRGLYAPERVDHTHRVEEMSLAEIQAEIRAILPELTAEERQLLLGPGEVIEVAVAEVAGADNVP